MAHTFPSAEWLEQFKDEINRSQSYAEAAATWEGDFYFVVEPGRVMDYRSFTNSTILCHFADPGIDNLLQLLRTTVGIDADCAWVGRTGERITNLKRALNYRFGARRAEDNLPQLVRQALAEGNTGGQTLDLDRMLRLFYAARGWDQETGEPLPERLLALDLPEAASVATV